MSKEHSDVQGESVPHPLIREAMTWLDSSQGRARARSTSQKIKNRFGYPYDPQDLRFDALCLLWLGLERNPRLMVDNIGAYCTTIMKNLCNRQARIDAGIDIQKFIDQLDEQDESQSLDGPDSTESTSVPPDFEERVACRDAVHPAGEFSPAIRAAVEIVEALPLHKAAVLNFLTLQSYPEIDCTGCPRPKQGSNARQQVWWPSIFFATRNEKLFPMPQHQGAAQRQRLRNFRNSCESVLQRAGLVVARKVLEDA